MALLLAFIVMAVLSTLSLFQWYAKGVRQSRKRVRELQVARWLADMALDELEHELRRPRSRDEAVESLRMLFGDGLSWDHEVSVEPLRFDPVRSREAARLAYGSEAAYGGRGVEIFVRRQPLVAHPRVMAVPDESEGVVVATCTAAHGEGSMTLSRVLEFRQTVASPPWGFDQCAFVALDWAYYRNRFQIFARQVLGYLEERREFIRTLRERVTDKRSVLEGARNWAQQVGRLPNASQDRWVRAQCGENADVRARFLRGIGYRPDEDQIWINLKSYGVPYFRAMEELDVPLGRYRDEVLPELQRLLDEEETIARFRLAEESGERRGERFDPWRRGGELVPWEEYVITQLERVFTLTAEDGASTPAPVFYRDPAPVDQSFFAFRNKAVPFEEHPELLDPGKMFSCPPPVVNQIWAFDPEGMIDGFSKDDFEAWREHVLRLNEFCQVFVDHYRGEVEEDEGKLLFANSGAWARRYAAARMRLVFDVQKRRATYLFPNEASLKAHLVSQRREENGPVVLDGVYCCATGLQLGSLRYRGKGWIAAPLLEVGEVRGEALGESDGLVLYGERGIAVAEGGLVEAAMLAPLGSLETAESVSIVGSLVVAGLGPGDPDSAQAMRDEIATPFTLRWDRRHLYVNPEEDDPGSWDRRRSMLSVAPAAFLRGARVD